jgi:hypothetical protein
MKTIKLTQGFVAIVDDEDYELVSKYAWRVQVDETRCYAVTGQARDGTYLRMHNLIKPPHSDLEVDHEDGSGLNNCKSNLQIKTHQLNCMNRRPNHNKTTKGVRFRESMGRWQARINIGGKIKSIGHFATEEEASNAFKVAHQNRVKEVA